MSVKARRIRNIPLLLYDSAMITTETCQELLSLINENSPNEALNVMRNLKIGFGLSFGVDVNAPVTLNTMIDVLVHCKEDSPISSYKSIW